MLSRCFFYCSVGVGVFVTVLSQISSFFSYTDIQMFLELEGKGHLSINRGSFPSILIIC